MIKPYDYSQGNQTGELFTCGKCKRSLPVLTNGGTGYGSMPGPGRIKHCYDCCAKTDVAQLQADGKGHLYLTDNEVTNWPGTLVFPIAGKTVKRHNWARVQYDVWFVLDGHWWHGVQYGDNTQVCHVRRTKEKCLTA